MLRKKIKHLYVVKNKENMEGAPEQKELLEEREEAIRLNKKKFRRKVLIGSVGIAAAAIAVFLLIYLPTYTKPRVADTYKIANASDNNYKQFGEGVLKYSRDGIAYLNQKGEEQWNQPYQIKNPFIDVNEKSAAVADKGGNNIIVLQEGGPKGEIRTALPIEKITVSEQGIVGAILKNETTPQIICYDAAGNILVEHKASLAGTGYPLDIALSADGELMQVVYMLVEGSRIVSKVCYYNFGKAGAEKPDHLVAEKEYDGSIMATGFFVNDSVSVVIGDNCLTIFKGKDTPKEVTTISIEEEIQSVFHSDKYIGMTVKKEGKSGYELWLYNVSGRRVMSEEFEGTYKSVKISGKQIIMYDGKKCSIFTRNGIHRFEGEMDNSILEIFPVSGVNKYIVMNANGMENVRLVK